MPNLLEAAAPPPNIQAGPDGRAPENAEQLLLGFAQGEVASDVTGELNGVVDGMHETLINERLEKGDPKMRSLMQRTTTAWKKRLSAAQLERERSGRIVLAFGHSTEVASKEEMAGKAPAKEGKAPKKEKAAAADGGSGSGGGGGGGGTRTRTRLFLRLAEGGVRFGSDWPEEDLGAGLRR